MRAPIRIRGTSTTGRLCTFTARNPYGRNLFGRTPLHFAANEGGPENVAALLDAGAYIKARDHRGMTPLHLRCGQLPLPRG